MAPINQNILAMSLLGVRLLWFWFYYAAFPTGRIKCCTPSVCASVCLSVPCHQFSRNRKAV